MVVPHCIEEPTMAVTSDWVVALRTKLKSCLAPQAHNNSDALAAITLFTSSLDWFLNAGFTETLQSLFDFEAGSFSIEDAKIIFGPKLSSIFASTTETAHLDTKPSACLNENLSFE